ncbi:UNVERIFIED_CONTAM: hypothetical protein Scaly_2867700 [Sesamum calycinum]|uniref:Retrotransposon gag domain-containing protein n=1 Tax=Sesamum calycinum TaxID=2727403 RepID=A0AAW2LC84_9LAMI
MADELPVNYRTPAIDGYDGTTDPQEHLSHFENVAPLHRYTDGIKCQVFVSTFARAVKQWFNQLPPAVIRSFQEFCLFSYTNSPVRFNTAVLEVPTAIQEVKANAFAQRLLDRDFFKSLAKKPATKSDALLARAVKYINMEDAQAPKASFTKASKPYFRRTPYSSSREVPVGMGDQKPIGLAVFHSTIFIK